MTEAEAFELVAETFVPAWEAATNGLPLVLENESLSPAPDSYGMLTMKPTVSGPITTGAVRRIEYRGWFFAKIWVPTDGGRKTFAAIADAVRKILQLQALGTSGDQLIIFAGLTQIAGTDGRWFMGVVQFPYVFHDSV